MSYSVIISTYNRFDYLQEAIKSALDQTVKPLEIIVINDGSTDVRYNGDWDKKYGSIVKRLDLQKNSSKTFGFPNRGYVRNVGISNATGDYIAILDDDDIWLPHKMERQLEFMKTRGLQASCTEGYYARKRWDKELLKDYSMVKNYDKYVEGANTWVISEKLKTDKLPDILDFNILRVYNFTVHSSIVYHKKLWDMCGRYPEYRTNCEDYILILNIARVMPFAFLKDPSFVYDGTPNRRVN